MSIKFIINENEYLKYITLLQNTEFGEIYNIIDNTQGDKIENIQEKINIILSYKKYINENLTINNKIKYNFCSIVNKLYHTLEDYVYEILHISQDTNHLTKLYNILKISLYLYKTNLNKEELNICINMLELILYTRSNYDKDFLCKSKKYREYEKTLDLQEKKKLKEEIEKEKSGHNDYVLQTLYILDILKKEKKKIILYHNTILLAIINKQIIFDNDIRQTPIEYIKLQDKKKIWNPIIQYLLNNNIITEDEKEYIINSDEFNISYYILYSLETENIAKIENIKVESIHNKQTPENIEDDEYDLCDTKLQSKILKSDDILLNSDINTTHELLIKSNINNRFIKLFEKINTRKFNINDNIYYVIKTDEDYKLISYDNTLTKKEFINAKKCIEKVYTN